MAAQLYQQRIQEVSSASDRSEPILAGALWSCRFSAWIHCETRRSEKRRQWLQASRSSRHKPASGDRRRQLGAARLAKAVSALPIALAAFIVRSPFPQAPHEFQECHRRPSGHHARPPRMHRRCGGFCWWERADLMPDPLEAAVGGPTGATMTGPLAGGDRRAEQRRKATNRCPHRKSEGSAAAVLRHVLHPGALASMDGGGRWCSSTGSQNPPASRCSASFV